MANEIVRVFTKGDRLRSLRALLVSPDGAPVDLSTGSGISQAVMFRLIKSSDGSDHITGSTAGITIVTASSGEVRWDPTSSGIDTVGDYFGWFIRYQVGSSGMFEHFPAGRALKIRILGDT